MGYWIIAIFAVGMTAWMIYEVIVAPEIDDKDWWDR